MNHDYEDWLMEQISRNERTLKVVGICLSVIIIAAIIFAVIVGSAVIDAAFEGFF